MTNVYPVLLDASHLNFNVLDQMWLYYQYTILDHDIDRLTFDPEKDVATMNKHQVEYELIKPHFDTFVNLCSTKLGKGQMCVIKFLFNTHKQSQYFIVGVQTDTGIAYLTCQKEMDRRRIARLNDQLIKMGAFGPRIIIEMYCKNFVD